MTTQEQAALGRSLQTSTLYRVEGHAGLWYYRGPAVVITDEQEFEHDGFVLMAQAADPDNIAVVEPSLVTAFVVADTEPVGAVGLAQERQTRASELRYEDVA